MAANKLNDLSGKEWVRFTKSWFTVKARSRGSNEIKHPAKYPEELVMDFVSFFTKENELVFDPFAGVGSTMVGCQELFRRSIGIELNDGFYRTAIGRLNPQFSNIVLGDSRTRIVEIENESIDFIITSPPYWDILKKQRGHSNSQHKERLDNGLPLYYSNDNNDLGNIEDYDVFLEELVKVFRQCNEKLKKGKYMAVVVQNFRNVDGHYVTFAWDLANRISEFMTFCGEKIWIQENKTLGIWGFPFKFIPNIHHHYCLIFQKQ